MTIWGPRAREHTALHEAGHATIGTILGLEVSYCAVTREQVDSGAGLFNDGIADTNGAVTWVTGRASIKSRILSKYAGECAVMCRYLTQDPSDSSDWRTALELDPRHCVSDYVSITYHLCWRYMSAIERVADALVRNTSQWPLSGDRVREIIAQDPCAAEMLRGKRGK